MLKARTYFYCIFFISLIGLFLFTKPIKNYIPIFFVVLTFPIFIFKYYNKLIELSDLIKRLYPELFDKYVVDYGFYFKGNILNIGLFSKIKELEKIDDNDINTIYFSCILYLRLGLLSFICFGLFAIATVYLN